MRQMPVSQKFHRASISETQHVRRHFRGRVVDQGPIDAHDGFHVRGKNQKSCVTTRIVMWSFNSFKWL